MEVNILQKLIFIMRLTYKYIFVLFILVFISFSVILLNSCVKKPSSSDCSGPADKIVTAQLAYSLGGVNIEDQVYYSTSIEECEIAINNGLNKEQYLRIESALQPLLGFEENANIITKAFTLFIGKELDKDSLLTLSDVVGISRYFTKSGKLFHQLFIKNSTNSFSESKELAAEVDGVIFNYVHQIAKKVLKINQHATGFFMKTEDSKDLYKNLQNPYDDLGWKLKIWIQKNRLHPTIR